MAGVGEVGEGGDYGGYVGVEGRGGWEREGGGLGGECGHLTRKFWFERAVMREV